MKLLPLKKPDKYYTSLLLTLTVSITTTILVLSTILYMNFENIALTLIHTFIKDNLSQVSYSATFMSSTSKSLALQMYFDADISKFLFNPSIEANEMQISYRKIDSFRNTSPLIHSIYVYNGKAKKFYSTILENEMKDQSSFFDKEMVDILTDYQTFRQMTVIPRIIHDPYKKYKQDKSTNIYTVVFSDTTNTNMLDEAIILNISEMWLRNIIDSLGAHEENNTFIIDKKGKTMISSKKYPLLEDVSGEGYIAAIMSRENPSGYFVDDIDGIKSLVTYASYPSMDWIFIRTTPYTEITGKINSMKIIPLLSALLILAIGLLISYIMSRKLYKPITGIVEKLKSLEEEKRENHNTHRQNFLRSILHGETTLSLDKTDERYKNFEIKLDPAAPLLIILLKIDNYIDFCNKYTLDDRNLLKFGIVNIATEICSECFSNEAVDAGESLIVLFMNVPGSFHPEKSDLLYEMIRKIQFSVAKYLEISLSATVGIPGDFIRDIVRLYGECLDASQHRTFYGHRCIIHSGKIKALNTNEYIYPIHKEKLLFEALMLGKAEDAAKIYYEIMDYTAGYPYSAFQSAITRLASGINVTVDNIRKNSNSTLLYNFTEFIAEVTRLETLESVNEYFLKTFNSILSEVERKKNAKHDDLLKTIDEVINREYSDSNLSIDTIADGVNMSPVYLGRLFKKLTSKSVSDYISDVRMEKSKFLMKTTELSINEILDRTGFVSSGNYYTLFKKIHGITPNEYRQKK